MWSVLNELRKPGGEIVYDGGYRALPSRRRVENDVLLGLLNHRYIQIAPEPRVTYRITDAGRRAWVEQSPSGVAPDVVMTGRCDRCGNVEAVRPVLLQYEVPARQVLGLFLCNDCREAKEAADRSWTCDGCGEVVDKLTTRVSQLLCDDCLRSSTARRAAGEGGVNGLQPAQEVLLDDGQAQLDVDVIGGLALERGFEAGDHGDDLGGRGRIGTAVEQSADVGGIS